MQSMEHDQGYRVVCVAWNKCMYGQSKRGCKLTQSDAAGCGIGPLRVMHYRDIVSENHTVTTISPTRQAELWNSAVTTCARLPLIARLPLATRGAFDALAHSRQGQLVA